MKLSNPFKFFTFFLYMPWIIDFLIAACSFLFVLIIMVVSISNRQVADFAKLIFGLIALFYGVANTIVKINNDRKELDVFKIKTTNIFDNFRNMVLAYYPDSEELTHKAEEKVLKTYFDDWNKHKDIKPFEYQLMDSYLNHIVSGNLLEESDKLFLKYRIVTSDMTSYFPTLVFEIEKGDYFTNGTAHNKFIKKIYLLVNNLEIKNENVIELEPEMIQDTISYALKKSNPVMENLLRERQSREKIQYLITKCYENAYSNIGTLDLELDDNSNHNLILLFKYDERFSIPKRQWHTEIKNHLSKIFAKAEELEREYAIQEAKLKTMLSPQPFSRAIQDFDYCIERLAPKENFMYVIFPERFGPESKGWPIDKFINERVIPNAKQYLGEFNKKLIKEYPYLRGLQKRTIDANYYVFHFNRKNFSYYADQTSIPTAIKRFIVKSVLESDNAVDHLASQMVYVKRVINNITISGLLFTESLDTQKNVQAKEKEILRNAKKNNLIMSNVNEVASIGNQLDLFVKAFFEAYFEKTLKRKKGKNYQFAKKTTDIIVKNAKELL